MRTTAGFVFTGMLLLLAGVSSGADDSAALIALDKQWGEAGVKGDASVAEKILADNVLSVTETGVRGRQAELDDTEPAPAGTKYEPTDYKVVFLDADTAIMTHGTKGDDAHHSLHVWSRKGGSWKIVATSSTPVAKQ